MNDFVGGAVAGAADEGGLLVEVASSDGRVGAHDGI